MYTSQDWMNYLVFIKIRYYPDLPRVISNDVKPKMIELDRKIGWKSVICIHKLFIDKYEPAHLVYQSIHYMEVIGGASD